MHHARSRHVPTGRPHWFMRTLGLGVGLALVISASLQATPVAVSPAHQAATVHWPDVMVQLHGGGKAFIVDPETDQVLTTLDTCQGGTLGATTPDASKVYVSCAGEGETEIIVIDLAAREVTGRVTTGNRPKHAIFSPDGQWLGVNHWGLDAGKLRHTFITTADDEIAHNLELEVTGTAVGVTSMHNA